VVARPSLGPYAPPPVRETCPRCLRRSDLCLCADLVPAPSRTRVVILQHPREARLAICSAWLARLALDNAELHRGVLFDGHARLAAVCAAPGTALLFPGPGAAPTADAPRSAGAPPDPQAAPAPSAAPAAPAAPAP